jgi:hypothetical protein
LTKRIPVFGLLSFVIFAFGSAKNIYLLAFGGECHCVATIASAGA